MEKSVVRSGVVTFGRGSFGVTAERGGEERGDQVAEEAAILVGNPDMQRPK